MHCKAWQAQNFSSFNVDSVTLMFFCNSLAERINVRKFARKRTNCVNENLYTVCTFSCKFAHVNSAGFFNFIFLNAHS